MMERRTACGLIIAAIAGAMMPKKIKAGDLSDWTSTALPPDWEFGSSDITFDESLSRNLVIERLDGRTITIPFTEIFDALERR